jgi:hypothetical protein
MLKRRRFVATTFHFRSSSHFAQRTRFTGQGKMTVAMHAHGVAPVARLPATRRSTTRHAPSFQTSAFVGKAMEKVHITGRRQKYLGLSVKAVQTYVIIHAVCCL